jgi:hypothetical protein
MVKVSVSRCSVAGDAKWGGLLPIDCQCFELVESGKGASFLYISICICHHRKTLCCAFS